MNDRLLIELLISQLAAALSAAGLAMPIVQLVQPTQQGTNSEPTVYFQKISDRVIGTAQTRKDLYGDEKKIKSIEIQPYETIFQISNLFQQTPGVSQPTASDVLNSIKMFMTHKMTLSKFRASNVGLLRVSELRNNYFHNDLSKFQAMPSFFVTFTYNREISLDVGVIDHCDSQIFHI